MILYPLVAVLLVISGWLCWTLAKVELAKSPAEKARLWKRLGFLLFVMAVMVLLSAVLGVWKFNLPVAWTR